MDGELEVIFGTVSLICNELTIHEKINAITTAMLRVDKNDFLALGAVNYLDEVVINSVSQKSRLFIGNIVSIKDEPNNQIGITLGSGVEVHEIGIKALTVTRVDHREVAYSMARLAGFHNDHIVIHGLDSSVKTMVAFVPFKGLLIEENHVVGKVQLLNMKSVQENFSQVEKNEIWNGFFDADGWICFRFAGTHFSDAELLAIEKADVFLSAYNGLLQYGYSQFDGDFIEWERTREAITLKRQNHILVVMLHNSAIWLRDISFYKPTQTKPTPTITLDIEAIMDASENFQLPLLIWNRFRDSEDYYVVTIGLWQVFELFAPEHKYPKRFKILKERFQKYLENIGLVLSKHDQDLLDTFRKIRNDIEHGRKPEEPSVQEIKRVKALVNRVILASLTASKSK